MSDTSSLPYSCDNYADSLPGQKKSKYNCKNKYNIKFCKRAKTIKTTRTIGSKIQTPYDVYKLKSDKKRANKILSKNKTRERDWKNEKILNELGPDIDDIDYIDELRWYNYRRGYYYDSDDDYYSDDEYYNQFYNLNPNRNRNNNHNNNNNNQFSIYSYYFW